MKLEYDFKAIYEFGKKLRNYEQFEQTVMEATQELAKILHRILKKNTPVDTGELKAGWDGENLKYKVEKVNGGYEVTFTNKVEYAWWVNYGHLSYNQFNVGGEPYEVKNRVKVTSPKQWQNDVSAYKDAPAYFVYGHFFVEQSVLAMEKKNLEKTLYKELEKWFEWCCI